MSTVARALVKGLGLPVRDADAPRWPTSALTFPDGTRWHVEIPSVEGPVAMAAVLDAAERRDVPVHRVSQGSGIMLLLDDELDQMVALGRDNHVEVCLFVGPRASWDVGRHVLSAGGTVGQGALRGPDQLVHAVEDVRHACEHGLRSVLVADLGLLDVLSRLRETGDLPGDLVLKVSVSLPVANPATARVLQDLGADTLNLPPDLTIGSIGAIRAAVDLPLDMYVEAPDDLGGTVRHHEIADLVDVAAPVHLKFGLRNAPGVYPSGGHLEATAVALGQERVRRAAIGLALLERAGATNRRAVAR